MKIEAALFAHCSLRTFIKGNEEMTRHFTRACAEAIGLFKSNQTVALQTLPKYTSVTHAEILNDTYNEYPQYL
ncbi:MAG TPA: hypothetical protein VEI95_16710, partial [Acidobacteriota bacterium]|nr:hypothetical protein [Acidobacteriota bacterium]